MIAARSQWKLPPSFSNQRASARSVPRVFQIVLIVYVLLTGELVRGAQAALFGLQGGGDAAFTAAVLLAIALDIARIGPVFLYARHPLGILNPLILTTVLWPLLVAMPRTIEEFGGLGGLLLGDPVSPPFYSGLGWLPGPEIWRAVAWANLCELVALLSIYAGYALARGHDEAVEPIAARSHGRKEFDGKRLRLLAIVLIAISVTVLLVLISLRGGLALHLADMARGRFRSLAGLGPLVSAVDLGLVALLVWVAARPADAKQPLFVVLMLIVAAAQFVSNGSRSAAFAVFIMVGLTWALRNRRIPWRLALLMLPAFFLSFGALNIIRTSGLAGQSATEAIEGVDTSQVLSRVQEEIELRRSLESTVPVISEGHELMNGPLWGSSYGAAFLAFVPRWMWDAKPRGPGSLYAQNFLGEVREGLAVPVNPTAEEYWNFGILGVILISALYGALIRYAHGFYIRRQDNPFVVSAFVVFVTTFHPSTDDLVLFQQQATLLLIVLGFALLFSMRIRTDPRRPEFRSAIAPLSGPRPIG
jgi:hypothetical protein